MWARHMELMLALWMAVSPFVFRFDLGAVELWLHDYVCAALIGALALVSHWRPLHRAHLIQLLVALWLMGAGWWFRRGGGIHPHPAFQNWILVGLLLAMFAIVPSDASRPPAPWQRRA